MPDEAGADPEEAGPDPEDAGARLAPMGATAPFATVRRIPGRARYDRESLHAVLDAGTVGHVGLVRSGRAAVIPMLYGRAGDRIFLHGSVASRLQRALTGSEVCLTVTVVDGLVFARSAFHHSMNYRSAVVFGLVTATEGERKLVGLHAVAEHLTPGRWEESRPPSPVELRQTSVLELTVEHASVKIRDGGPVDEPQDVGLPIWAGVVPMQTVFGRPATDTSSALAEVSPAVRHLVRTTRRHAKAGGVDVKQMVSRRTDGAEEIE